jgi:predicted transcriptional regulator
MLVFWRCRLPIAERSQAGPATSSVIVNLSELSRLALNRGLSLTALCDHADVARGTLGRVIAGRPVRRETLFRLYATLIDVGELPGFDTLIAPTSLVND